MSVSTNFATTAASAKDAASVNGESPTVPVRKIKNPLLRLAMKLIGTPSFECDGGCMNSIAEYLEPLRRLKKCQHGFTAEHFKFPNHFSMASALWAAHTNLPDSQGGPTLVLLGHTDVVSPGILQNWIQGPYQPYIRNGYLYGRGATDMKGPLAALVVAFKRFVTTYPNHAGRIGLLIVDDEEQGPDAHGTHDAIVNVLAARGYRLDWCIAAEPSSDGPQLGNRFKYGCRGSLTGDIHIHGHSGHVGYPRKAVNALTQSARVITALDQLPQSWDADTDLSCVHTHAGEAHTTNVIPGFCRVMFNIRFSGQVPVDRLKSDVLEKLDSLGIQYEISWLGQIPPFISQKGHLVGITKDVIRSVCGVEDPRASTEGGIGDFRFFAQFGGEAIELGPNTDDAHTENERVRVVHLYQLAECYFRIMVRLLIPEAA